jgi:hypothetical protein
VFHYQIFHGILNILQKFVSSKEIFLSFLPEQLSFFFTFCSNTLRCINFSSLEFNENFLGNFQQIKMNGTLWVFMVLLRFYDVANLHFLEFFEVPD